MLIFEDKGNDWIITLPALIFTMGNDFLQSFINDVQRAIFGYYHDNFFVVWRTYIEVWAVFGKLAKAVNLRFGKDVRIFRQSWFEDGIVSQNDLAMFDKFL